MARRRFGRGLASPQFRQTSRDLQKPGELGRAMAQPASTAQVPGRAEPVPVKAPETTRTEIFTFFTRADQQNQLLYQAESWVRMRLLLETAGPVAVGTRESVSPPLSGRGITLPTNVEVQFSLARGNRVYIAASAVNRVRVIIEPIPWAEQLASGLSSLLSRFTR